MLSFRDGDGRGAEGIIAYERIPKATSFGEKAMTETLKKSKSWRNQTKSEPQLCFILPGAVCGLLTKMRGVVQGLAWFYLVNST